MKIVVTGSLGNISKPLATALVQKGHDITVISSDHSKQQQIEDIGATAAIGSLEDKTFLATVFTGKDAVYTMIPPNNYFDQSLDLGDYYRRLGTNYAHAVRLSGVKRHVHLSSIGAHLECGNGILSGTYVVEQILRQNADVAISFMRPTSFYYNLLGYMHGIVSNAVITANYGASNPIPWVSPYDIAAAVEEELLTAAGTDVRYVCSEELTGPQTAKILGDAIGLPELEWKIVSTDTALRGLLAAGMNKEIAAGLVEMYEGLESGLLSEHYFKNRPAKLGVVKMKDYSAEFSAIYHKEKASR